MARAIECLITAETAIRIRDLMRESGTRIEGMFICKGCKQPVKVMVESDFGAAHFEHFHRNVECPYSDKGTVKRAYKAYKAQKATAGK